MTRFRGVIVNPAVRAELRTAMKQRCPAFTLSTLASEAGLCIHTATSVLAGRAVDRASFEAICIALGREPHRDDCAPAASARLAVDTERGTATSYFDAITVRAGERVFLDESFDDYPVGTTRLKRKGERILRPYWHGYEACVTCETHAPGSAPACWKSVYMPNSNCGDVIELEPEDLSTGDPLVIEFWAQFTHPSRGFRAGLVRHYVSNGEEHELPFASVTLDEHLLVLNSITLPSPARAGRWHRVRLECDPARFLASLWIDGRMAAMGVPWTSADAGYRFTHFEISGVHFLADAPEQHPLALSV